MESPLNPVRSIADMTQDEFKQVLEEVLQSRRVIDEDTHRIHHRFIQVQIERDERRAEMWRRFKLSFIGGLALAVLGFLGWLGSLILSWVQNGGHHG